MVNHYKKYSMLIWRTALQSKIVIYLQKITLLCTGASFRNKTSQWNMNFILPYDLTIDMWNTTLEKKSATSNTEKILQKYWPITYNVVKQKSSHMSVFSKAKLRLQFH